MRTRNGDSPQGKPRVYFTCYKKDFNLYFDKICDDIFKTKDCAIYYSNAKEKEITQDYFDIDLSQMNLFVIPVSFNLLCSKNRTMNLDFPFAKENHIPVLPIIVEKGIDSVYSKPENFGNLQYLVLDEQDSYHIGYEEKLRRYLESILIGEELSKKVRDAFDAYVFLSYRKKDRKYANELMHIIHSNEECRDLAIWYDEYLVPGEDFNDAIEKALIKSDLFALLVTPNLVNEDNYIKTTEYPKALATGKPILPAEIKATDQDKMFDQFKNIPKSISVKDKKLFKTHLLESLKSIALMKNENDPNHTFLIGLAYLEGIDVEVDKKRALDLITSAAKDGVPEAAKKLYDMYYNGLSVEIDWNESLKWIEKFYYLQKERFGKTAYETLMAKLMLSSNYTDLGKYQIAKNINEEVYETALNNYGDENPLTLTALNNLFLNLMDLGNYSEAVNSLECLYSIECRVYGFNDKATITTLNNLARALYCNGEYRKAKEYGDKAYNNAKDITGTDSELTLTTLSNLALYNMSFDSAKAANDFETVYLTYRKKYGKKHPKTIQAYSSYMWNSPYSSLLKKSFQYKKVYMFERKIKGKKHPETIQALFCLAENYYDLSDLFLFGKIKRKIAKRLANKAYLLRYEVLGEYHPETIKAKAFLAKIKKEKTFSEKTANRQLEEAYAEQCKTIGPNHPETVATLKDLAEYYINQKEYDKALDAYKQYHQRQLEIFGENSYEEYSSMIDVAYCYGLTATPDFAKGWFEDILASVKNQEWFKKLKPFVLLTYYSKLSQVYYAHSCWLKGVKCYIKGIFNVPLAKLFGIISLIASGFESYWFCRFISYVVLTSKQNIPNIDIIISKILFSLMIFGFNLIVLIILYYVLFRVILSAIIASLHEYK